MTDLSRWCALSLSLSMALHLAAVTGLTLSAPTRSVRRPQAIMVVLDHMIAPDLRRTEAAEAPERAGRLPVAAPVSARRLVASNLKPGVEPEKTSRPATPRTSQQQTPQAVRQETPQAVRQASAVKVPPDEMSAPVRSEPLQSSGPATLPAEPGHSLIRSQGATETAAGAVNRLRAAGAAVTAPQAAPERSPLETGQQRYLKRQFGYIQELIAKRSVYPPLARRMNWSGKTVLAFSILEDGSVHGIRVVQSSGHAVLDQSALATVRRAAPFPKPPARAEIVVPINFRMEP
jgi:protein TonB